MQFQDSGFCAAERKRSAGRRGKKVFSSRISCRIRTRGLTSGLVDPEDIAGTTPPCFSGRLHGKKRHGIAEGDKFPYAPGLLQAGVFAVFRPPRNDFRIRGNADGGIAVEKIARPGMTVLVFQIAACRRIGNSQFPVTDHDKGFREFSETPPSGTFPVGSPAVCIVLRAHDIGVCRIAFPEPEKIRLVPDEWTDPELEPGRTVTVLDFFEIIIIPHGAII